MREGRARLRQVRLREVMGELPRLVMCPRLHFIRGTLAAAGRTGRCHPGAHLGSAVGEVDAEMLSVISAPRCARTSVSLRQMMWDGEVGLLRTPKKSLPGWRMEESQQDHPPNGSQQ